VAVAIGFPIALVIAWAFELTPEGLKRTEDVDASGERVPKKHAWIYVVAIGAAISVGLFFVGRYSAQTPRQDASPARTEAATVSTIPQKSIAVLPFENLSDDKSAAYFAEGIQDEILTKLASIADLKVISRTSTAKDKSKPEDLKTVSQQLGVANVLEGSVQKAADKVRVNVQLIDARADSHLWAKTYDRDLADVFAIQSEVAQEIADSLKAKLSPAEANTMASAPTKDMQAYDLFLKGEFEQRVANSNFRPEAFD
jgi:TolB-like protein